MSDAAAMQLVRPVAPEDQSRADLYGLLARLFYLPPDANLISELRLAAPPPEDGEALTAEGDALKSAWAGLVAACGEAFPALVAQEHQTLFAGVGKAEVTPYLSAYLVRSESDTPLARLRGQLAAWGLARREEAVEPEDHVSALCETMRWLIVGQKGKLEVQRRFFEEYLYTGGSRFCSAVSACEQAKFYRSPAALLQALLDLEHKAFEID
ncbi:MAG: TorD/DmsD family molecular chaperone [Nevskiales bacterium]